jgi:hypothetical protein
MNLFDILENRMQELFEGNRATSPLPFKKLAKQTVRQMKRNAAKVDGRTLAPSLYTVVVNPADDAAIAPLYQQVTDELVDFVAHEVQNQGLTLLAEPMVRFIAEPAVKQGRPEVIAEVVSADILDALRREEGAYVQSQAVRSGRAAGGVRPAASRQQPRQNAGAAAAPAVPAMPAAVAAPVAPAPAPAATEVQPRVGAGTPQPVTAPTTGTVCELRDAASGRTWRISAASTTLGRDESSADLVLPDTNISRRHAQLTRDTAGWHLADLGSTNGTRVNGLRVGAAVDLHSGDTVSLGLVTLEFREL